MALTNEDKQWFEEKLTAQDKRFDTKLAAVEERIVTRINKEVTDLAEVNHLALAKLDEHSEEIALLKRAHAH